MNLATWWALAALATLGAALDVPARSGDFILTTTNETSILNYLTVLSPTGSIRFTLQLPRQSLADGFQQTTVSSDGLFAFSSVNLAPFPGALMPQPAILVTRLTGSNIQAQKFSTVLVPAAKGCAFMSNAPIAGGPLSQDGSYAIYVGLECYTGCDGPESYSQIMVPKLRYYPAKNILNSAGASAFTAVPQGTKCARGTGPIFFSLRVIDGQPFGLLYDNIQTVRLLQLGSSKVGAIGSSKVFDNCIDQSFTIASPTSFYGLCSSSGGSYDRPMVVTGNTTAAGMPPPAGLNKLGFIRFMWTTTAAQLNTTSFYSILYDTKPDGNTFVYRSILGKLKKRGEPIFQISPQILSAGSLATLGSLDIRQLLIIP